MLPVAGKTSTDMSFGSIMSNQQAASTGFLFKSKIEEKAFDSYERTRF